MSIGLILLMVFCSILAKISDSLSHHMRGGTLEKRRTWIFFVNKGPLAHRRSSMELLESTLHPKVVKRRRKTNDFHIVDESDLPIYFDYERRVLDCVEGDSSRIRHRSKWLNGMSMTSLTPDEIQCISELSCVKSIDLVRSMRRQTNEETTTDLPSRRHINIDNTYSSDRSFYGQSYDQLDQINVLPFHQAGYFGEGVTILILDSGFHLTHRALHNLTVLSQWDFVNNNSNVALDHGDLAHQADHGTQTLSCAVGYDPGHYIAPAPRASLLLAKTEDLKVEVRTEEDNFAAGLEWGEERGADVMTSSLGYRDWYGDSDYDGRTSTATRAVNSLIRKGVVCVVSAGNSGSSGPGSLAVPADSFFIVSVGAVDSEGHRGSFSGYGPTSDNREKPEVCARGVGTRFVKARSWEDYRSGSGTSYAAPLVGGLLALVVEKNPKWSGYMVRKAVLDSAKKVEAKERCGWGMIQGWEAGESGRVGCDENKNCIYSIDEQVKNGYLFTCYKTDGGCDQSGYWICDEGKSGENCEKDYICKMGENCAFQCVNNMCVKSNNSSNKPKIGTILFAIVIFCLRYLANTYTILKGFLS